MVEVVAVAVPFFAGFWVAGLVTRRWLLVPVAAICWPIYYQGLRRGWWGNGVGENWEDFRALLTLASTLGAAWGVMLGRGIFGRPSRSNS